MGMQPIPGAMPPPMPGGPDPMAGGMPMPMGPGAPGMGQVVPFMAPPMMPPPPPPLPPELQAKIDDLRKMAEAERNKIGTKVVREYRIDRDSRKEWEDRAKRAMDMAAQKKEAKTFPWPNASNVKYPLLTTAALQFAARAYPAICDGPRIVKCQVMGADPDGSKAGAADRVSQHMSYQLLFEVDGWESSVDTSLHQIPIIGCAFRKVYDDPTKLAGFGDDLVSAFDFVVHQKTKSLSTVPRATHTFSLYPHEIRERQRAGRFLDVDIDGDGDTSTGDSAEKANTHDEDDDAPHTLLEQHRFLDLDGDGVEEPWIVTVHEKTEKVLRIAACFDPDQIEVNAKRGEIIRIPRRNYFVKIPFVPDPAGGFYDVGFGHLLEPMSDVIDTTINQMMDAGTLQNSGGGFIGAGVSLGKGKSVVTFRPGEYRTVQAAGDDLRRAIVNFEHPGPSQALFNLLGMMIEAAKDVASIKDILTGEQDKVQTATTTMAMIEQGLKVFTAIYKRIFRAMKDEFQLIFEINKRLMSDGSPKYVALLDVPVNVAGQDYAGEMDVMPIADPNTVTDMQRMSRAQLVLEEAKNGNPAVNIHAATKRAFEAARIERPEEVLIPPPDPDAPKEPSPDEQAMMMEMQAKQADLQMQQQQAQLKTEALMMDLQAKAQAMQMQMQATQREAEQKAQQAELDHQNQLRALGVKSEEMDQRWRALQVKEAELEMKREAAEARAKQAREADTGAE